MTILLPLSVALLVPSHAAISHGEPEQFKPAKAAAPLAVSELPAAAASLAVPELPAVAVSASAAQTVQGEAALAQSLAETSEAAAPMLEAAHQAVGDEAAGAGASLQAALEGTKKATATPETAAELPAQAKSFLAKLPGLLKSGIPVGSTLYQLDTLLNAHPKQAALHEQALIAVAAFSASFSKPTPQNPLRGHDWFEALRYVVDAAQKDRTPENARSRVVLELIAAADGSPLRDEYVACAAEIAAKSSDTRTRHAAKEALRKRIEDRSSPNFRPLGGERELGAMDKRPLEHLKDIASRL